MRETLSVCIPIEADSHFACLGFHPILDFTRRLKMFSPGIHPATKSLTAATELGRITPAKPLVADYFSGRLRRGRGVGLHGVSSSLE